MDVLQHQVADLQGLVSVDDALETLSARVDRLDEVTAVQGLVPVCLDDSVAALRGRVQRLEDIGGNLVLTQIFDMTTLLLLQWVEALLLMIPTQFQDFDTVNWFCLRT